MKLNLRFLCRIEYVEQLREAQFGFRTGLATIEALFITVLLQESREYKKVYTSVSLTSRRPSLSPTR